MILTEAFEYIFILFMILIESWCHISSVCSLQIFYLYRCYLSLELYYYFHLCLSLILGFMF